MGLPGDRVQFRQGVVYINDRAVPREPLDDSPDWRPLESGELVHVDRDLNVSSRFVLEKPPAHRLWFPIRRVRDLVRDVAHRVSLR